MEQSCVEGKWLGWSLLALQSLSCPTYFNQGSLWSYLQNVISLWERELWCDRVRSKDVIYTTSSQILLTVSAFTTFMYSHCKLFYSKAAKSRAFFLTSWTAGKSLYKHLGDFNVVGHSKGGLGQKRVSKYNPLLSPAPQRLSPST